MLSLIYHILVAAALLLAWRFPNICDGPLRAIETCACRLAAHPWRAALLVALAPIVLRLALLAWIPVPSPRIHDEFSYLLGSDTLAHGRLANPPHPLWVFFDTIHVNGRPTYMSKYPPGQAAALAFGEVLGNPWFGVVLSVGAMCAAVLWMLRGWLPPRWALLGAVLALFRVGIFSYWMNSYWGGAVAAIGGALVTGALPRLVRRWRARDAWILALGAFALVNSRPFEGLICCLPVAAVLAVRFFRSDPAVRRAALGRVAPPLCLAALCGAAFVAYFNWRGTGNPWLPPYVLNDRNYLAGTPSLVWQASQARLSFLNPQFERYYNSVIPMFWSAGRFHSLAGLAAKLYANLRSSARVFVWPELLVPLLALPWIMKNRKGRFLLLQFAAVFGALLAVVWFEPHYLAPVTAAIFGVLALGIRYIRRWRFRGRPAGRGLSRAIVALTLLLSPFHYRSVAWTATPTQPIGWRAVFARRLDRLPGRHLVIVRYSPQHSVFEEWVYNSADIDGSKVVWAREIPGRDPALLLSYFRDRRVWLAEPDASPPRLLPYQSAAP
jgi:hypothetical protein